MVATAIIGSAVVGAGASLAAGSMQADSTDRASVLQAAAQKYSADQQMKMYDTTRADLMPYQAAGQVASNKLMTSMDDLTKPIYMDETNLQNTPGYQFNLSQGLKATQNSAAARGLGTSGAALRGAATFATGLADSTYQNQFSNEVANRTNKYNMLMGSVNSGQNAAAQTGTAGTTIAGNIGQGAINTANAIGNNTVAGGTARAAGLTGAAASLTNGVNNYLMANGGIYGGTA